MVGRCMDLLQQIGVNEGKETLTDFSVFEKNLYKRWIIKERS
jgi:hypothetical protein